MRIGTALTATLGVAVLGIGTAALAAGTSDDSMDTRHHQVGTEEMVAEHDAMFDAWTEMVEHMDDHGMSPDQLHGFNHDSGSSSMHMGGMGGPGMGGVGGSGMGR